MCQTKTTKQAAKELGEGRSSTKTEARLALAQKCVKTATKASPVPLAELPTATSNPSSKEAVKVLTSCGRESWGEGDYWPQTPELPPQPADIKSQDSHSFQK